VVVSLEKMSAPYRTISHEEAQQLITAGTATIIDVRTPGEYEQLGHIPGAWLLPVDIAASAPAVLSDKDAPVLVYCEHGVRSRHASDLIATAGFTQVFNMAGGLATWSGPREFGPGAVHGPAEWLLGNADLLPRGGRVLDVACGRGRHALLMASAGFDVTALDLDAAAIDRLRDTAGRLKLLVQAEVVDLETDPPPSLGSSEYDVVLVFNYLHRALMPSIREAVKPGGLIYYETFTTKQAERGHPRNPDFLLKDGELAELVAPFTVVRSREGEFDGRFIASVVATRPQ
jgi:tellurite methyltransferase